MCDWVYLRGTSRIIPGKFGALDCRTRTSQNIVTFLTVLRLGELLSKRWDCYTYHCISCTWIFTHTRNVI